MWFKTIKILFLKVLVLFLRTKNSPRKEALEKNQIFNQMPLSVKRFCQKNKKKGTATPFLVE